jgi:hypothetical protein
MRILPRKDGYKYTQTADVPLEERMILSIICLADTANESDWKLITEAEADEIKRQQEESMNEQ